MESRITPRILCEKAERCQKQRCAKFSVFAALRQDPAEHARALCAREPGDRDRTHARTRVDLRSCARDPSPARDPRESRDRAHARAISGSPEIVRPRDLMESRDRVRTPARTPEIVCAPARSYARARAISSSAEIVRTPAHTPEIMCALSLGARAGNVCARSPCW